MAGSNHRRIQVHYADRIRAKLTEALAPVALEILDESQKHVGHAGYDPRGETHFRVTVVSEQFAGKSRVDRQRLVYGLLAAELSERVHALALKTITPAEKG
jgi:BolA family transcriptional regulator, general stress-responsive regulator